MVWYRGRYRRESPALHVAGGLASLLILGGVVLAMRWNDRAWMDSLYFYLEVGGVVLGVVFVSSLVLRYRRPGSASVPTFSRSEAAFAAQGQGRRLDTVVVCVAVRGVAGQLLLAEASRWKAEPPTQLIRGVTEELLDKASAWWAAGWMDDDPVPYGDAEARIAIPLSRLSAELPDAAPGPQGGYRDNDDDRVVVVAFGGTTDAHIPNLGGAVSASALTSMLESLQTAQRWHHARLVTAGPMDPADLTDLPVPLQRLLA